MSGPNFGNSTRPSDKSASRFYRDWDAPSELTTRRSQAYSERSYDSGTSFSSRSDHIMNSGNGGNGGHRGGRGGRGRGGLSGGRGGRKYSSSSGSSNSQHRPVIRQSPAPCDGRMTPPPAQRIQGTARVNSPVTPYKEQSSFILSGNNISEIYTPSESANIPSPRSRASPTTPTRNNYGFNTPTHKYEKSRPVIRNNDVDWAHHQEFKIRLLGIPRTYWTKQVYQALSQYGNVVRIEIIRHDSRTSNAWIVFQ
jgi:RNA-dependent RNA polymerase